MNPPDAMPSSAQLYTTVFIREKYLDYGMSRNVKHILNFRTCQKFHDTSHSRGTDDFCYIRIYFARKAAPSIFKVWQSLPILGRVLTTCPEEDKNGVIIEITRPNSALVFICCT